VVNIRLSLHDKNRNLSQLIDKDNITILKLTNNDLLTIQNQAYFISLTWLFYLSLIFTAMKNTMIYIGSVEYSTKIIG